MDEKLRLAKTNPYFCILPFTHSFVNTDSSCRLCCISHGTPVEKNVIGKDMSEIWQSETYQEIRRKMINGEPVSQCNICYDIETRGGGSDRETHNKEWAEKPVEWDIDIVKGNTLGTPLWADMRPGRLCNYACRMCWGATSSTVAKEHLKYPDLQLITNDPYMEIKEWIDDENIFDNITKWIPNLHTLKLAGGEPFFMPGVLKLIKWCVDTGNTHLRLDITTNGSRTQGKVTRWLEEFRAVSIQFSMCGIGYTNDYIRHGADWVKMDKAYKKYLNNPKIKVHILSTVQVYNAFDITNIIQYWLDNGAQGNLILNTVDGPADLRIDILPMEDRLQIANDIESLGTSFSKKLHKSGIGRIEHVVARLREEFEPEAIQKLRTRWAIRTRKFDQIRNNDISRVHPKLEEYCKEWS